MNLEPVSSETSAQPDIRLQDPEEDQAVSIRIAEAEFPGAPLGVVHCNSLVQHPHRLEFGVERIRIVDWNAELETSERSVFEVRLLLAVHMEPDVITADARIVLGVLFVPEVDVESKTVRIEKDGFLNVTDVENWNGRTKSGVCHIKQV